MIVADLFLILTLVLVLVAYRRARRARDEALEELDDPGGHVRNVRRFDR